jgi:hypothetical protein
MYTAGLQRRKIVSILIKYLVKELGLKVTDDSSGDFDLVAEDPEGLKLGFKIVEGAGRIEDKIMAAGRLCHRAPHDRVYIVIDRRGWLKLTGLKELRSHFKEVYQAGLLLVDGHAIQEIFPAPKRDIKQLVKTQELPAAEKSLMQSRSWSQEERFEAMHGTDFRDERTSLEEETEEVNLRGPKKEDLSGLPSFIQDNPWLRILSRDRKR